jgi:hypothetical protein
MLCAVVYICDLNKSFGLHIATFALIVTINNRSIDEKTKLILWKSSYIHIILLNDIAYNLNWNSIWQLNKSGIQIVVEGIVKFLVDMVLI